MLSNFAGYQDNWLDCIFILKIDLGFRKKIKNFVEQKFDFGLGVY